MCNYKFSSRVTLYCTRIAGAVLLILLCCFPVLLEEYHLHLRFLLEQERTAITAGFYVCAVAVIPALWNMDRLLCNILQNQLFTMENVQHIRAVRWCCLAVCVVCFAAGFGFRALFFLSAMMGFLFLVVTVVGQVLKAAVAIQEENDLTV